MLLSEGGANETVTVKPNNIVGTCLKWNSVTDGLYAV